MLLCCIILCSRRHQEDLGTYGVLCTLPDQMKAGESVTLEFKLDLRSLLVSIASPYLLPDSAAKSSSSYHMLYNPQEPIVVDSTAVVHVTEPSVLVGEEEGISLIHIELDIKNLADLEIRTGSNQVSLLSIGMSELQDNGSFGF